MLALLGDLSQQSIHQIDKEEYGHQCDKHNLVGHKHLQHFCRINVKEFKTLGLKTHLILEDKLNESFLWKFGRQNWRNTQQ